LVGIFNPEHAASGVKNVLTHPNTDGKIILRHLQTDPIIPVSLMEEKFDRSEAILKDDDGLHYWKKIETV
jgi:hypothetical protein